MAIGGIGWLLQYKQGYGVMAGTHAVVGSLLAELAKDANPLP